MKIKFKIMSKAELQVWIVTCNLFVKSLISSVEAVKQFNSLDKTAKESIKRAFDMYDDIRRKKLSKDNDESAWIMSVMVDSHIIATEFNIDPLTATMCLNLPCKLDERVYVK